MLLSQNLCYIKNVRKTTKTYYDVFVRIISKHFLSLVLSHSFLLITVFQISLICTAMSCWVVTGSPVAPITMFLSVISCRGRSHGQPQYFSLDTTCAVTVQCTCWPTRKNLGHREMSQCNYLHKNLNQKAMKMSYGRFIACRTTSIRKKPCAGIIT